MTMVSEYRGADNLHNPHERSLSKFLRARSYLLSRHGYLLMRNGQVVREQTLEFWKAEGRTFR